MNKYRKALKLMVLSWLIFGNRFTLHADNLDISKAKTFKKKEKIEALNQLVEDISEGIEFAVERNRDRLKKVGLL